MARPKKDNPNPSASDRIADAFWELLKDKPFSKITIRGISEKAHVNHNTFYHYYESMTDLALSLLDKTIEPYMAREMAKILDGSSSRHALLEDADFAVRFPKVILFANSGSLELQNALVDKIMSTWLQAYEIEAEDLTQEELIDLNILFRLIVVLLSNKTIPVTPDMLDGLLQRDLGRGMVNTLMRIIASHTN